MGGGCGSNCPPGKQLSEQECFDKRIKAACSLLGTAWVGGTEQVFSQEQLLARPQGSTGGQGRHPFPPPPNLAGVRNVPEASHHDTALLCTILVGLGQSRVLGAHTEAAVECGELCRSLAPISWGWCFEGM